MNKTSRRSFMAKIGVGTLAAAGVLAVGAPARAACQRANGAGSYQLGPFAPVLDGDKPVYLVADWGFDETMAFCKVTTNFAPFRFPTARLGTIDLDAHEFYMEMRSESIDTVTFDNGPDGPHVNLAGALRSETRVFSGDKQKTFIEDHLTFGCDATLLSADASVDVSKTNFSMIVRFNPSKEHAALFGSVATFSGRLTQGNIIVVV